MNQNRRKFMRMNAGEEHCVVTLGIDASDGVLINNSIEGLRVGQLELLMLVADQKVTVAFDGMAVVGRCRSVSRDAQGLFQIGVYRESEFQAVEPTTILLNSFMRFDGRGIVCVPLAVMDDDRVQIRLMDGTQFVVNRDQLFQITRDEREQELRNDQKLKSLTQIYSTMDSQRNWYSRDDVLLHEFGPPLASLVSCK